METVSNENITVKQLADELGISPQGLNKYLRTSGLQEQAIKNGNRFLLPPLLAEKVRNHFQKTETKTETETAQETMVSIPKAKIQDVSFESQALEALTKQLAVLQTQLETKDKQIDGLQRQIDEKDKQINDWKNEADKWRETSQAAQLLHAADKKDELLAPGTQNDPGEQIAVVKPEKPEQVQEKKQPWWKRWFG